MRGKWIKLRVDLDSNFNVLRMADKLNISRKETAFLLYRLASWFAVHGKHGVMKCHPDIIDAYLNIGGLANELLAIGWLRQHGPKLTLHHFTDVSAIRKGIGNKLRKEILTGASCAACGRTDGLVIDHIIPISRGGGGDRLNLQALCAPCNIAKGKKTMDEFMRTQTVRI